MRFKAEVEVFVCNLHADGLLLVAEVAGGDDVLFAVLEYDNWCVGMLASAISDDACAWRDELAEMLVCVVLGSVAHFACLAVHMNECILFPPPSRFSSIRKDEIPIIVFVNPITQVVGYQEKGVLARFPIH